MFKARRTERESLQEAESGEQVGERVLQGETASPQSQARGLEQSRKRGNVCGTDGASEQRIGQRKPRRLASPLLTGRGFVSVEFQVLNPEFVHSKWTLTWPLDTTSKLLKACQAPQLMLLCGLGCRYKSQP